MPNCILALQRKMAGLWRMPGCNVMVKRCWAVRLPRAMRLCALSISFNYEQSLGAHFLRKAEKITFQNLSSYFELL